MKSAKFLSLYKLYFAMTLSLNTNSAAIIIQINMHIKNDAIPCVMCMLYGCCIRLSHYITTINVKKKISCCVALNHLCIFYDCSFITDYIG